MMDMATLTTPAIMILEVGCYRSHLIALISWLSSHDSHFISLRQGLTKGWPRVDCVSNLNHHYPDPNPNLTLILTLPLPLHHCYLPDDDDMGMGGGNNYNSDNKEFFRCPSCQQEFSTFLPCKSHILATGHIYIPENMSKLKVTIAGLLPHI